ncbi:MAG TPA: GFA family protein [Gammaproteobacteria bacterium]|nr:GFA family protein [Gammaproteobacteria bacterium]
MTPGSVYPLHGGCDCRKVRYALETPPLFVHCCHCRWCQRETGAAFALNAIIEADRVLMQGAEPEIIHTPSQSGRGQRVARCPVCRIAVWSHYASPAYRYVRVGTLDEPDRLPPDIHIYTASKQAWVMLPPGVPAVPEYYDFRQYWPPESVARQEAIMAANRPG